MDLVARFSGPGDLVVHFCRKTMKVERDCLLLSNRGGVVRCKKNIFCVNETLSVPVNAYKRQPLSSESDFTANE